MIFDLEIDIELEVKEEENRLSILLLVTIKSVSETRVIFKAIIVTLVLKYGTRRQIQYAL